MKVTVNFPVLQDLLKFFTYSYNVDEKGIEISHKIIREHSGGQMMSTTSQIIIRGRRWVSTGRVEIASLNYSNAKEARAHSGYLLQISEALKRVAAEMEETPN